MSSRSDFAIVVVGAGPVGAACAALLARESGVDPSAIALLGPAVPADSSGSAPRRVSALSAASERLLGRAGAWSRMPAQQRAAYETMHIWHESVPPDGPEVLHFDAAEYALPNLGHIVDNAALQDAALEAFSAAGGTRSEALLRDLRQVAEGIELDAGMKLRCRLLIAADGGQSRTRELLGVSVQTHAYGQQAIVADIATARPHQHACWQRFLASGPLAFLPLANGNSSIVWSAADALAAELMALPVEDFAQRLELASARVLGATRLLGGRVAVPLRHARARALVGTRAALIGDAAHVIHPLAGQGVNLGLQDVAALVAAVRSAVAMGEDVGCARALRPYERARHLHNAVMGGAMGAFNALYSRGGLAGWPAARSLGIANRLRPLKHWFARQAIGAG